MWWLGASDKKNLALSYSDREAADREAAARDAAALEQEDDWDPSQSAGSTIRARLDVGRVLHCVDTVSCAPNRGIFDNKSKQSSGEMLCAVGGRNVLRVLKVGVGGVTEVIRSLNCTTGTADGEGGSGGSNATTSDKNPKGAKASSSTSFEVNDVAWAPPDAGNSRRVLAAATTNGVVSIWDVDGERATSDRPLSAHNRTVHRLKWHPFEGNQTLVTASQDSTVKIWDRRGQRRGAQCVATIQPNKGAVNRDVAFDPHDGHRLAIAMESGQVAIYDRRRPNAPVGRFVAHGGSVLGLAWHPTWAHTLATASTDCTVKVRGK